MDARIMLALGLVSCSSAGRWASVSEDGPVRRAAGAVVTGVPVYDAFLHRSRAVARRAQAHVGAWNDLRQRLSRATGQDSQARSGEIVQSARALARRATGGQARLRLEVSESPVERISVRLLASGKLQWTDEEKEQLRKVSDGFRELLFFRANVADTAAELRGELDRGVALWRELAAGATGDEPSFAYTVRREVAMAVRELKGAGLALEDITQRAEELRGGLHAAVGQEDGHK